MINLDENSIEVGRKLALKVPSVLLCVGCGRCVATCSVSEDGRFSPRWVIHKLRRGDVNGVRDSLFSCTLCGKCLAVCPVGVNTTAVILAANSIVE